MSLTNQLDRIQHMEQNLDEVTEAVRTLSHALDCYTAVRPQLQELSTYYSSKAWLEDYDADCAGLLPPNLKRGVLSQDAVYDLLAEHDRLLAVMRTLIAENEEN